MTAAEQIDVLVVGAGLSGIGAAYHLQTQCPQHRFVVIEGRKSIGGTWDLFRYPGVRSDSDMHTLGYRFKPWKAKKSIADGPSILDYLRETVAENGLARHIRFQQQAIKAEWHSDNAAWTVTVRRVDTGDELIYTCNFLFMCSGYYSYSGGYVPEFPGRDRFQGQIIEPQQWPAGLNYRGRRVVIIGSGATAVTLVPAMAGDAAHVTMLQRSPTYMISRPDHDVLANMMRSLLPGKTAYALTRWKNIRLQELFYQQTRRNPEKVRKRLLKWVSAELPPGYDVAKHFTPRYKPWDQRLCLVANGDFFQAIRTKKASVVTDHIETFTATGIRLRSGEELQADIIVTATGLQLVTLGEMDFVVDGRPVDFATTWTYKGLAYSDVPNLVSSFGYINASWTLRADLTCEYVCRLLKHMGQTGTRQCTPRLRPQDRNMPQRPWVDNFSSGYMQRMLPMLPKQGDRAPWLNTQRYSQDIKMFRDAPLDDGVMQFTAAGPAAVCEPDKALAREGR